MYDLDRSVDEIRPAYGRYFNCDSVVPEAIICFLEGKDYQDAVRLAISLGGDTDTMASMSGAIAAAQMEIPHDFSERACKQLPLELRRVMSGFYSRYKAISDGSINTDIPIDETPIPSMEDEAELLIAESPTDGGDTNGGLETALPKSTRASRRKDKEMPTEE